MERDEILNNVANMTAEQLFEEIKGGNITLNELTQTGYLDSTRRRRINELQRDLELEDTNYWERARYGNEVALSDYITNHPNGQYVMEAKQKIDMLERQREEANAQKQTILQNISRNPNFYGPGEIIGFLNENIISNYDLLTCNIPQSAIDNLHNIVTPRLDLGETPASIPNGFTEVYFWGTTGSGKTCAFGAILQMAQKKGYLNMAAGPGYRYATQLMNIFSDDDEANDYLPAGTPLDTTQYLPFTLRRRDEKYARSISLIEISGEIFKCFFDKNAGSPFRSEVHKMTFKSLDSFLHNKNRKIHFFFVDYNRNNRPDGDGITQSDYLSAASTYFKNHQIFGKSTDAIYIVLTKSDLIRDESGMEVPYENRLQFAKEYLNNNYLSFINTLKDICKKESINGGILTVEPFTLGNVYFQEICNFNGRAASTIVEILMDRIPVSKKSILDLFNK